MPHPGQLPQPRNCPHCWHVVYVGVPVHVGPVWKTVGPGGRLALYEVQQIC
jgi:hypothetical protein